MEMYMGNHLANRKWSCNLNIFDSAVDNNQWVDFWSHLKLSSSKMSTDARHYLHFDYFDLRRQFDFDAIVFLVNLY